jgi:hypothetical protein
VTFVSILLEVTDTLTGATRYITVKGEDEVPDLVAKYARAYARQFVGLPQEAVPQRLALFPGEEGDDLDAA